MNNFVAVEYETPYGIVVVKNVSGNFYVSLDNCTYAWFSLLSQAEQYIKERFM